MTFYLLMPQDFKNQLDFITDGLFPEQINQKEMEISNAIANACNSPNMKFDLFSMATLSFTPEKVIVECESYQKSGETKYYPTKLHEETSPSSFCTTTYAPPDDLPNRERSRSPSPRRR